MSEEVEQANEGQEAPQEVEQEQDVYDISRHAAILAEKEAELAEAESVLAHKLEEVGVFEKSMESAKEDPVAFAESLGITYEDYASRYLQDTGSSPQTEQEVVLSKIENLEKQLKTSQSQREDDARAVAVEKQREAYGKALVEVQDFVDTNEEKFDLIKNIGVHDVVLTVIGQHYRNTGEILDTEEACVAVQEHYEQEAERYLASEKLLTRLGLEKKPTQGVQQDMRPRTLTNNIGTEAPRYKDERPISREESLERAAALLRWS